MNMKQSSLKELGVTVYSGQIMSRLTIKDEEQVDQPLEYRVVIPKCVNSDGTINIRELPMERLKVAPDEKRVTKAGDIVMKLSTPYDAAIITEESAGCVIPSFCAIIKDSGNLDKNYLLAFLNSESCKIQLRAQVAGAVMTILSVGKISSLEIPVPKKEQQIQIGNDYMEVQRKLQIINRIALLSAKRNDVVFKELVRANG